MNGFELNQQRGVDGIGYVRALRSILTANLPALQPTLQRKIMEGFTEELAKYDVVNGILQLESMGVSLLSADGARLVQRTHVSDC